MSSYLNRLIKNPIQLVIQNTLATIVVYTYLSIVIVLKLVILKKAIDNCTNYIHALYFGGKYTNINTLHSYVIYVLN